MDLNLRISQPDMNETNRLLANLEMVFRVQILNTTSFCDSKFISCWSSDKNVQLKSLECCIV